jgi:hypothetical protein
VPCCATPSVRHRHARETAAVTLAARNERVVSDAVTEGRWSTARYLTSLDGTLEVAQTVVPGGETGPPLSPSPRGARVLDALVVDGRDSRRNRHHARHRARHLQPLRPDLPDPGDRTSS